MSTIPYPFEVRSSGALQAGLTPTWGSLRKLSDGTSISSPGTVAVISELGGGLYKIAYDPEGADGELIGVIDAGSGITADADRYITIVLAQDSSRVARLDATIASRSSHSAADVWAVSTRTLSSFGTLVADTATAVWGAGTRTLTAISDSAGITTLLARLTSTRAGLLDNLGFLTVAPPTAEEVAAEVTGAAVVLSGPNTITTVDSGEDGTVGLFVGDRYSLVLQAKVGGVPMPGTGATWEVNVTNESTGATVTTDFDAVMIAEEMGLMSYPLQSADTTSATRLRLTIKRTQGSDVRVFGPLILNVRDR